MVYVYYKVKLFSDSLLAFKHTLAMSTFSPFVERAFVRHATKGGGSMNSLWPSVIENISITTCRASKGLCKLTLLLTRF